MANEPNEDEPLFHAATYTQAPKVSHKVLTKEERQVLIKQHEEKQQEAAHLDQVASKGPIGRWWSRLQSGPNRITPAMAIVALGVVYGDIGTSPLYTMQTFLNGQGGLAHANREAVLGVLSLVFWSITLITTVKYVLIAMRIDNKGEGGIFALYSLVRKYGAWLAIPAMLGGAAFLADSVLTPAVSISSAVEGLETLPAFEKLFTENKQLTLMITAAIILMLFSVQSRGTERIGKAFGWRTSVSIGAYSRRSTPCTVLDSCSAVIMPLALPSWVRCSCQLPVPKRFIPIWVTLAVATSISRGRSSKSRLCSVISAKAHGCSIIGMIRLISARTV